MWQSLVAGDHITLQAAADVFTLRILIVSSYQEEFIIEILPHSTQESVKTLFLSFWHEVCLFSYSPREVKQIVMRVDVCHNAFHQEIWTL